MIDLLKRDSIQRLLPVLGYAISFLVFFTPADYAIPVVLDHIWDIAAMACSCLFVFLFLRRYRVNPTWICFSLFFVTFYLVSSLFNQSDASLTNTILKMTKSIGFLSLVAYGIKRNPRHCLEGFIFAGFLMCFLNFLTYCVFRNVVGGMQSGLVNFKGKVTIQRWYLLSSDNGTFFYYLPVAAAAHYYASVYSSKFSVAAWLFTLVSLFMYVDVKSASAMVAFALFTLLVVLVSIYCGRKGKTKHQFPNYLWMLGLGVGLNVFVIAFLNSDILLDLFREVFGKSSSIISRVEIWGKALDYYFENPLLGMGPSVDATNIARIAQDHAHNILIQIAYQGGTISILLFFAGCLSCFRGKEFEMANPAVCYLTVAVLSIFISGSFDFYFHYTPLFFPLFVYAFLGNSGERERELEREEPCGCGLKSEAGK